MFTQLRAIWSLMHGQRLRYAYTGIQFQPGGPTTGPRGNLRDSDSETSTWEDPLYNWCVHFDKPIQSGP